MYQYKLIPFIILLLCNFGKMMHQTINKYVVEECKKNKNFTNIFDKKKCNKFIENAAEPDDRKKFDGNERNKHFFHINAYKTLEFDKYYSKQDIINEIIRSNQYYTINKKKKIIIDIDEAEKYIKKNGYLPWSILETISTIKNLLKERNENLSNYKILRKIDDNILTECINLSHYIADMCTPLHININYDGRDHSQKGIHHMWESLIPKLYIKKYNINNIEDYTINNIEDQLFIELNNSYLLSEKILDQEIELSQIYKQQYNNHKMKNRFKTNKYARLCAKYYNQDINNQINKAITITSFIFNNLLFK